MKKILELKDVTLSFGGLKAVDGVNFFMNDKEILSLIGPNGAGKTSIFNLITGVYTPSGGDILFKGININKNKPYQTTQMGMARTFQNIRLFKQLTVMENIIIAMNNTRDIGFISSILSLPKYYKELKNVREKALHYLEYFQLADKKDLRAESLPYGKQRELEICRALATGAEVLLLDEPAAGLNPTETDYLMVTIKRIRDELQKGIFMIEHDMKLVMGISERIVVVDYGKKIAEGKPEEIRNNKQVIDAYLGADADNSKETTNEHS